MRTAIWLGVLCMVASTTAAAAPRKSGKVSKSSVDDTEDEAPKQAKKKPANVQLEDEEDEEDDEPTKVAIDDSEDDDDEEEAAAEVVVRAPVKPKAKPRREFYFRAGIAHVEPRTKSSGMVLEPVGIAKLMPMDPPKGEIVTDPANVFTAILGFAPATFRGYVSFETLIGIPKKSKLRATGDLANKSLAPTALDFIPTGVPPLGEEIGEASAAPLMVTATFRTPELGGRVRLYVGGGPSVLIVRGAKVTNRVLTEVATPRIETSPTVGFVAQIGADVKVYKRLYARFDIKEMWFMPTETRISNIHVKTTIPLLDTVEVGSSRSQVQANPLVVQFGLGAGF